jgi:hypothetical protein
VEVGERLFLHEQRLRHGVGSVGLAPDHLVDEALGFRVARLVRRAFQAPEDVGDDVAFLLVHGPAPSSSDPRRAVRAPDGEAGRL